MVGFLIGRYCPGADAAFNSSLVDAVRDDSPRGEGGTAAKGAYGGIHEQTGHAANDHALM